MDQACLAERVAKKTVEGSKMRVPAAIVLTMLIATPAMAIDIVSGSGAVVKNGAGLTVINGDPCSGRMEAACIDHEEARRDRQPDVTQAAVEPVVEEQEEEEDQKDDPYKDCDGNCPE